MSRVEPFWPRMSVSVTISSPAPGASRPWSSRPVVTVTTPAPGGQRVMPGATRAATSAAPSCSARRCADPTPAVTATTRRPADRAARRSVTSALPSPRYAGVAEIGQGDRVRVDRQGIAGQVGDPARPAVLAGCRHAERARGPPGDPEVVGGARAPPRWSGRSRHRGRSGSRCRRRRCARTRRGTRCSWPRGRGPWCGPAPGRRAGPGRAVAGPAAGQGVDQALHAVGQDGCERLHPLDGDPLGELGAHLGELGVPPGQDRRALAHGRGQQQLTAGRRPEPVPGDLERALVGHAEVADLLDVVAPELHPQGVLLGGREHVEDPAADGELAALLDQVGRGVADGHQGLGEVLVGDLVARAHDHGLRGRPGPGRSAAAAPGSGRPRGRAAPIVSSAGSGCASRRRTARRRPTVSELGLRRSCGRVSHAGSTATRAGPVRLLAAAARSSACRVVAVTARTRRWRAMPAARKGIAASGVTTEPCGPSARAARAKAGSRSSPARSPERSMRAPILPPPAGHRSPIRPDPPRPRAPHPANPPVGRPSRPVWRRRFWRVRERRPRAGGCGGQRQLAVNTSARAGWQIRTGPALGGIRLNGCSGPRATSPAARAQACGAARSHSLRPPGCR